MSAYPILSPLSVQIDKRKKYPYYRIQVKNYTVFNVVIDDVMEVRRIIYSRRDLTKLI
jgi:hypothetical protein